MPKVKRIHLHQVSSKRNSRFEEMMARFDDLEVKEKLKDWRDVTITDIESIRVRPAAQKDELAITILSKSGQKAHLLIKGHFA